MISFFELTTNKEGNRGEKHCHNSKNYQRGPICVTKVTAIYHHINEENYKVDNHNHFFTQISY